MTTDREKLEHLLAGGILLGRGSRDYICIKSQGLLSFTDKYGSIVYHIECVNLNLPTLEIYAPTKEEREAYTVITEA
jgi:hypothetical protein